VSDQPFYAPNRQVPPRQPRAGEHLWAIQKGGRQLACELRDDGEAGAELQVYRERELLYGRRFANRALALEKADEWKAQYLREGGVLIA
jgi:hypothetical protein